MVENPGFYLDDCSNDRELVSRLRYAGFKVTLPAEAGLSGRRDSEHFHYARSMNLVLITSNPKDFRELHCQYPEHPGILAIYRDNDINRDMDPAGMVAAIRNLLAALGGQLTGQFLVLNVWRY